MPQIKQAVVEKDELPLSDLLNRYEKEILKDWVDLQTQAAGFRRDLISSDTLSAQSQKFLKLFAKAMQDGATSIESGVWSPVKDLLADVSAGRAKLGFTPTETATFVFSLKQAVFSRLQRELGDNPEAFLDAIWSLTTSLDKLGLYTTEIYQKSREELIQRQQQAMLELSTPVVRLWEGVLALPLIGTLDSARTQVVMETLLQEIVTTGATIAIIDITGVPTVDTLVAQHLLKTVAAARLMGADCIISGIRPQIAQTIVHLGVELKDVITKSTLADAFLIALRRLKTTIAVEPDKR